MPSWEKLPERLRASLVLLKKGMPVDWVSDDGLVYRTKVAVPPVWTSSGHMVELVASGLPKLVLLERVRFHGVVKIKKLIS